MNDDITANYHGGNPESVAAKEASRANVGHDRGRIVTLAASKGPYGLTCDEAEILLNLSHQSCSARFSELKRDGVIVPSEMTRPTRSGARARVMLLAKP